MTIDKGCSTEPNPLLEVDERVDLEALLPFNVKGGPEDDKLCDLMGDHERAAALRTRIYELVPRLQSLYDSKAPMRLSVEEVETLMKLIRILSILYRVMAEINMAEVTQNSARREQLLSEQLRIFAWLLSTITEGKPIEISPLLFMRMTSPEYIVEVNRNHDVEKDVDIYTFMIKKLSPGSTTPQ